MIDIKTDERNGRVVGVVKVENETDEYLLVTDEGVIIRAATRSVSVIGRNTKGVRLINLDKGSRVVSVARYAAGEEEAGLEEGAENVDGAAESGADGDAPAPAAETPEGEE